jgi:hypothetical protein
MPSQGRRPGKSYRKRCVLLMDEGYPVAREDLAARSPSLTGHIKRFVDYVIDLDAPPTAPRWRFEPLISAAPLKPALARSYLYRYVGCTPSWCH